MSNDKLNTNQGHWLLAKMGKKVLRPGGKELTMKLIEHLNIGTTDDVVEFAPGLGFTAGLTLLRNPKTYTGVELNSEAAGKLQKIIHGTGRRIVNANAAASTLEAASADKVYGEAMLTMHADHRKAEIISEAARVLRKGGLYGIHELCLVPDSLDPAAKAGIQRELAEVIKVNARPLTISEWKALLGQAGFRIQTCETNAMHLLEPGRIIDDEGFFRTLRIGFNILRYPDARKRIGAMRKVFRKYDKQMAAVVMVAERIS